MVSSLQFCKAKEAELAWIDGVLDMRVSKVDTGVILEEGELRDDGDDADMQVDVPPSESSASDQQKAIKNLFGDDEKDICEESEIIPTLEPLPLNEVGKLFFFKGLFALRFGPCIKRRILICPPVLEFSVFKVT